MANLAARYGLKLALSITIKKRVFDIAVLPAQSDSCTSSTGAQFYNSDVLAQRIPRFGGQPGPSCKHLPDSGGQPPQVLHVVARYVNELEVFHFFEWDLRERAGFCCGKTNVCNHPQ
jgi:hypothetical protein